MRLSPYLCALWVLLIAFSAQAGTKKRKASKRLAFSLGVGLLDTGGLGSGSGTRVGTPQNFAFGLTGQREWKYLALDAEGFFALGSETRLQDDGSDLARSFQSRGTMIDLRGRYAFSVGDYEDSKFFAGLGGGFSQVKVTEEGASRVEAGQRLFGAYFVMGVEVRPLKWLAFRGDYARSFLTDGVFEASDGDTIQSLEVSGSGFERWRGRATVTVGNGFDLAGSVAYRTSGVDFADSGTSKFQLLQIAFEIGYRFR